MSFIILQLSVIIAIGSKLVEGAKPSADLILYYPVQWGRAKAARKPLESLERPFTSGSLRVVINLLVGSGVVSTFEESTSI